MSQPFIDYARIFVKGGAGGDGASSFRHEKYVPHGGPDGGDGGHGGSVWLEASRDLATLIDLKLRPSLKADRGGHGLGKNMSGKKGEDMVVKVPLGTLVLDEDGNALVDMTQEGQRFEAAPGGRGGPGNQHYATPTNQAPRKCKPGEPGVERGLILELRLIAQAGFVGLPNAGKSTLLAALTHATPRIAAYPFTTLSPNLGVMEAGDLRRVTLADIPGLIEGACHGAGLGDRFLRHIERTALLVHLVAPPETRLARAALQVDNKAKADAKAETAALKEEVEALQYAYQLVRNELATHSDTLARKPELVVLTKIDLLDKKARKAYLKGLGSLGVKAMEISAETGEGVDELQQELIVRLDALGMIPGEGEMIPLEPRPGAPGTPQHSQSHS